jgi:hypothetical protein
MEIPDVVQQVEPRYSVGHASQAHASCIFVASHIPISAGRVQFGVVRVRSYWLLGRTTKGPNPLFFSYLCVCSLISWLVWSGLVELRLSPSTLIHAVEFRCRLRHKTPRNGQTFREGEPADPTSCDQLPNLWCCVQATKVPKDSRAWTRCSTFVISAGGAL